MSGRRKGRVLVVDDDGKVGQRLAAALQQAGYVVVTGTTNGRVGLLSDLFDPNVIITRLTESPSEGLAELRNGREVPVIVVAGADSSVLDRAEALRTGIDSLMTDPPPVDEVLARLEFLMRRRGVMRVVRVGDLTIDRDGHCVRRLGVEVNLTPREYDLVLLLASNPG